MKSTIPVSVVIPTKNEEASILSCIDQLSHFSQIVVVDSDSTDRTRELARNSGAEVVNWTWNGSYPKKKQWSLDHLQLVNDWVLFIDADEAPTPQLCEEIRDIMARGDCESFAAFDIELDYVFLGVTLRHGHRVVKRALVDRRFTRFPELGDLDAPGMGEQEGHYQPLALEKSVGRLTGRITHNDRDPFSSWVARHNRYSDWESYLGTVPELRDQISRLRSSRGRKYSRIRCKPLAFFLYSYILRLGFLDGRAGFHYALAHSFYYWQISVKTVESTQTNQHLTAGPR